MPVMVGISTSVKMRSGASCMISSMAVSASVLVPITLTEYWLSSMRRSTSMASLLSSTMYTEVSCLRPNIVYGCYKL